MFIFFSLTKVTNRVRFGRQTHPKPRVAAGGCQGNEEEVVTVDKRSN